MPTTVNDHDLLVRLDTKLDTLSTLFAEVRSGLALKADASRVEKLEAQISTKANWDRAEKLEGKVEALQMKVYMACGAVALLQFGLHWLVK
jgi:hypothetical protein